MSWNKHCLQVELMNFSRQQVNFHLQVELTWNVFQCMNYCMPHNRRKNKTSDSVSVSLFKLLHNAFFNIHFPWIAWHLTGAIKPPPRTLSFLPLQTEFLLVKHLLPTYITPSHTLTAHPQTFAHTQAGAATAKLWNFWNKWHSLLKVELLSNKTHSWWIQNILIFTAVWRVC